MKKVQLCLLVALMLCFVTKNYAQKGNYKIDNTIGITGGITQFDIVTDNFITKSGNGFTGGLRALVDIPVRWYNMSFGMQFSENNIEILGRPALISTEETYIKYKMIAVQLSLMGHIKIIPKHFTIDVGPMLQYNGKLEFKDKDQKGYFINNYANLSAEDITNISQFNFNGVVGASIGIKNIKVQAHYIYGFTNILNKLENQDLNTIGGDARFKGNQTMLVLGAIASF